MTDEVKAEMNSEPVEKPEAETAKKEDKQDTFDRAYVEELRKEAAKYRSELRKAQAALEQQEADRKLREETELAEQQKWQQLAEKRAQEIEALKQTLRAKEVEMVRVRVAAEFGLNVPLDEDGGETLADRLRGETEDDLRKDAARLARLFKAPKVEDPEPAPEKAQAPVDSRAGVSPVSEARRQTTAVPGGQPVGRTDTDRQREYLSPSTDSPIFQKRPIRVNSKSGVIE